jgi:hypothetical protein
MERKQSHTVARVDRLEGDVDVLKADVALLRADTALLKAERAVLIEMRDDSVTSARDGPLASHSKQC